MTSSTILVFNAGSSSLKYALFRASESLPLLLRGNISSLGHKPQMTVWECERKSAIKVDLQRGAIDSNQAMQLALTELGKRNLLGNVSYVGHRIVHGGQQFKEPTLLDDRTLDQLQALVPLAPMHQPRNLEIVKEASAALPTAMQFGCFDTAFHQDRPQIAKLYGLPRGLTESGIISYGFHGISYSSIASCLRMKFGPKAGGRVIVAHLGSGASLCAMQNGVSVATTMGFSPLEGLVMSTRCGSIDPGVILHLLQHRKMNVERLAHLLECESGLLGVSGISGDMQTLISSPEPFAKQAIDLFVYRTTQQIASLAASMSGLDMLVFCAGIGENAPIIREMVGQGSQWLGVEIDAVRNARGDETIGTVGSKVAALVIPTDEERAVAKAIWAQSDMARP